MQKDPHDGDESREVANIQLEMDAIVEQVVWLLCPGLKDGTEKFTDFPTVQQRALHLLAQGNLLEDHRGEVVDSAIRWLQLAARLMRLGAAAPCPAPIPAFLPGRRQDAADAPSHPNEDSPD
jgi:hypothetical protein